MKNHILHAYSFNLMYAQRLVADIDDARMAEQPHPGMNHPAWVLGHLANTADFMGTLLGLPATAPAEWKELFGGGSQPTTDRSRYPGKDALLSALQNNHERVAKAFADATDVQLAAELPIERMRQRFPTVGNLIVFGLTSHETLHLGQLSMWRRVQGLPSAF